MAFIWRLCETWMGPVYKRQFVFTTFPGVTPLVVKKIWASGVGVERVTDTGNVKLPGPGENTTGATTEGLETIRLATVTGEFVSPVFTAIARMVVVPYKVKGPV